VTLDLLRRERVDVDSTSPVMWVPFSALRTGRRHLFDFADGAFAYPYKVLSTILMAAAHATGHRSRVVISYSAPADDASGPSDGYYLVVYTTRALDGPNGEDELASVEDADLKPHDARKMTASTWIKRRLMSVSGIAALAELGCVPLPPPPTPAAAAAGGADRGEDGDEAGEGEDGGGMAPAKKKYSPVLRLHPSEHGFWGCMDQMFVVGKLAAVVRQYMARWDDPYTVGGRNQDRAAIEQAFAEGVAVQAHNYVGGGMHVSAHPERDAAHRRELSEHHPHDLPGFFVPKNSRLSFLVPPNRNHPGWISEYHMPHLVPYVDINNPDVIRWCNAAMVTARADGANPTFDEVLARVATQHQTEVAHASPPIYEWVEMMKKRYKSGRESRQALDQIYADQMSTYMNPDNADIGHCSRVVCAWMETNMPRNTWADMPFVQTHPDDDGFTAGMRLLQTVMNHAICLSGGHELFRALILLISMERCSFSHEGGSSQVLATGLPGAGKSNIMTLYRKGCPDGIITSTAYKSALANTANTTVIGGIDFADELSLGRLGISDNQKTDPTSALQLALNGGPTDCASKGNEVGANIDKMKLGGENMVQTEMLVVVDKPDGTKERVKTVTNTFTVGVSCGFSNFPFGPAPAIDQRTYSIFVAEDPRRKAVNAALLSPHLVSEELFAKWTQLNKRRLALFQLIHVGIAAGFLPDVDRVQLGQVLARFVASMEAMSCPVITGRTVLRASRYIRWQAMDTGMLLYALFSNPTRSCTMPDLRSVMALSSVTWSMIVSTVTLPDIGFGLGEAARLVLAAIRDRYFRNWRDGHQLTGHVLSDRVPQLEHLPISDFVRYIARDISPTLGGQLTPAQILYQIGMMTNDRLTSPTTAGRRIPLILYVNTERIAHIRLLGAYLRNTHGPALAAIISCIPSSTDAEVSQRDMTVFTSCVGPDGNYIPVRIPRREVVDDGDGGMRESEVESEFHHLEKKLDEIGGEIDSLRTSLRRWVEGHAMQISSNLVSTAGDVERARKEAAEARRHQERVYSTVFDMGENREVATDDSELPEGMRELDPRFDPAEDVAAYMAEKARIKALLDEKQEMAKAVSASMASMAMVNPVTLRRGLVTTTSNLRDATSGDREFASKWGVELPAPLPDAVMTDTDFSRTQLQACGFTPEEIILHAGYAPNTQRLLAARAAVDAAFVALRDVVAAQLEHDRTYSEMHIQPGDEADVRTKDEMRRSVSYWGTLVRALCKAGRVWQHTRQNMIGANSPLDMPWSLYWCKTHFGNIYKTRDQQAALENLASLFMAGCAANMQVAIDAAVRCADSMGFVRLNGVEVRTALQPDSQAHEAIPSAASDRCRGRARPGDDDDDVSQRRTRPRTDEEPVLSM
jgi:hypothetical protein